jgi:hydroxypyruvate isomerase
LIAELRFDANLRWLFTELPFEERFDAAAAAGFTAVEYASPYPWPAAVLKGRLTDAGLTQILINSPVNEAGRLGYACLPGRTAEFRAGLELALEYAVALDCCFVHVLGGIKPDDVSHDRAFAHYVSNIAWAAEQARGTGVRLVLEAQNSQDAPGYIMGDQARAAAVVEAIGMDHVGMLFDVYHAQITETDLIAAMREYLPMAFHVQIADPPARTEPGTGDIPWRVVFDTLRAAGYDGWIGCEYRPATETVPGLRWLTELAP